MKLLVFAVIASCIFISCRKKAADRYTRLTYSCCSPECLDREHLLTEEEYDKDNKLIAIRRYYSEEPHHLLQWVSYEYEDGSVSRVIDSTEFEIKNTEFIYDNNRLNKMLTVRSRKTVVNEYIDTIPHTRWEVIIDTVIRLFEYEDNRMIQQTEIITGDTNVVLKTAYDENEKVAMTDDGTVRTHFTYLANDSIGKLERMHYTVSASNVSSMDATDAGWRLFETIEFGYDSAGRKIEALHYDDLDNLIYHFRYRYDNDGKLISIYENDHCDTVIYR